MMRRACAALLLALCAALPTACAAGTYTVTADDAEIKAVAARVNLTPQQVVQRVVDEFVKNQQQAEINRKAVACRSGKDDKACSEIPALVKKLK